VQYKLFSNIMNDLGSYFSIFSVCAQILSLFYTDYFYTADLLNAVFNFHDEEVLHPSKGAIKRAQSGKTDYSDDEEEDSSSKKSNKSSMKPEKLDNENFKIELQNYDEQKIDSNDNPKDVGMGKGVEDRAEFDYLDVSDKAEIKLVDDGSLEKDGCNSPSDSLKGDDKKTNAVTYENNDKTYLKKSKQLLNCLPFNEENHLEKIHKNKTEISPWELMCECFLKLNPRNKARYEIINKCKDVCEKYTNVEYMIQKQIELNFFKNYLLSEREYQLFKFQFKSINMSNVDKSIHYLKFLNKEGIKPITKSMLIEECMKGNKKMLDVFYDYHTI